MKHFGQAQDLPLHLATLVVALLSVNFSKSTFRSRDMNLGLHPDLSRNYSPPACGGIKGGLKGHFTSCFALSFDMSLNVIR